MQMFSKQLVSRVIVLFKAILLLITMGSSHSVVHPELNTFIPKHHRAFYYDKASPDLMSYSSAHETEYIKQFKPDSADQPKRGVLYLKTRAVTLTIGDVKLSTMIPKFMFPQGKAVGTDTCGEVVFSTSDEFKVGDLVIGETVCMGATGGLADYCAVPAAKAARIPAGADPLVYVNGMCASTAVLSFERAGYREAGSGMGKTCLIIGASGGVGIFAVQHAKNFLRFSKVIGVSSDVDFVLKKVGADECVDYRTGSLKDLVPNKGIDFCMDCASGPGKTDPDYAPVVQKHLLRPKGGFLSQVTTKSTFNMMRSLMLPKWLSGFPGKKYDNFLVSNVNSDDGKLLDRVVAGFERGDLKPIVHTTLPFAEQALREGFEQLRSRRAKGRIIVDFAKTK